MSDHETLCPGIKSVLWAIPISSGNAILFGNGKAVSDGPMAGAPLYPSWSSLAFYSEGQFHGCGIVSFELGRG